MHKVTERYVFDQGVWDSLQESKKQNEYLVVDDRSIGTIAELTIEEDNAATYIVVTFQIKEDVS